MLIVGEKEAENGEVNVRKQGGGEQYSQSIDDFAVSINKEVEKILKEALTF